MDNYKTFNFFAQQQVHTDHQLLLWNRLECLEMGTTVYAFQSPLVDVVVQVLTKLIEKDPLKFWNLTVKFHGYSLLDDLFFGGWDVVLHYVISKLGLVLRFILLLELGQLAYDH